MFLVLFRSHPADRLSLEVFGYADDAKRFREEYLQSRPRNATCEIVKPMTESDVEREIRNEEAKRIANNKKGS